MTNSLQQDWVLRHDLLIIRATCVYSLGVVSKKGLRMEWQPPIYHSFINERTQPAIDLVARVSGTPHYIVDMGCGSGNSTTVLCRRWPNAHVVGIDQSEAMLRHVDPKACHAHFIHSDMDQYIPPQPLDLVFSNAALHWVDHPLDTLQRWSNWLSSNGQLAVQFPLNFQSPAHLWVHDTLRELGLPSVRVLGQYLPDPDKIWDTLAHDGYRTLMVWDTTYFHRMASPDEVVTWMEGAGLRPVKARLTDDEWALFLSHYRRHIHESYPAHSEGGVVFPFTRRFIHGSKGTNHGTV